MMVSIARPLLPAFALVLMVFPDTHGLDATPASSAPPPVRVIKSEINCFGTSCAAF